jgi:hypothetical protein
LLDADAASGTGFSKPAPLPSVPFPEDLSFLCSILEPNLKFHFEIPKIRFLFLLTIYSEIQLTISSPGHYEHLPIVRATHQSS